MYSIQEFISNSDGLVTFIDHCVLQMVKISSRSLTGMEKAGKTLSWIKPAALPRERKLMPVMTRTRNPTPLIRMVLRVQSWFPQHRWGLLHPLLSHLLRPRSPLHHHLLGSFPAEDVSRATDGLIAMKRMTMMFS